MTQASPTRCYCLGIRRASHGVTRFYDRVLEPSGVTISQFSLLLNISRSRKGSLSELADMLELDRSTLARNVRPLLARGLVYDDKPDGARDSQLTLTASGKEILEAARSLWEDAQQRLRDRLGPEGLTNFENVLQLLETL